MTPLERLGLYYLFGCAVGDLIVLPIKVLQ